MPEIVDQDLDALKRWVGKAWRQLGDPSLTSFDRREMRNYMKEAEIALRAGLERIAKREKIRREAEMVVTARRRLDFRIVQLDV
jgi:hypothetical protein